MEPHEMKVNFIGCDRTTVYLLPPSVEDWLPEGHLARFVVEVVEKLDLYSLKESYSGRGSYPYSPVMLVALLFYGYATGVFSSRKLERSTYDSIAFRYITANSHPDHDTIAAFRRRFLPELTKFFVQILEIASQMNVLKLGTVSLDGTKVKANASKHKAFSYDHALRLEQQLNAEVAELLKKAEAADKADIPDGMSIPEEIIRREERLKAIVEAKAEIEHRAALRHIAEQESYEKKVAERSEKQRKTGKKPKGSAPKPPIPGPTGKDQVNLTDSESRIMPSDGGFEQAYNAQAAVDNNSMLIVADCISQNTNDKKELEPALGRIDALPKALGAVGALIADSGYFSEANVTSCEAKQITPYIAPGREVHNQPLMERFLEPPSVSDDADCVARMKHRLKTIDGKAIYAKRKGIVEPVFGIIKSVMGFKSFLLRGLELVTGEWRLVCIAWNLKRLHVLTR
jgi:transposase